MAKISLQISEHAVDDERPTIDGDVIRGVLVLGNESKNPADTDRGVRGRSTVNRKFRRLMGLAEELAKLDGSPAHIGPHRYDGVYPDADLFGHFSGARPTPKGCRMDVTCRKIGEAYHPQAAALRDHVANGRAFGGFSPLFDGEIDEFTGEVERIIRPISIDWVLSPGSLRSVAEESAIELVPKSDFDALAARVAELETRPIVRVSESTGGARVQPPPSVVPPAPKEPFDAFRFIRS